MNKITDTRQINILALDDHPMVLEGMAHVLSAYSVTTVTRAKDMFDMLRRGSVYNMFILDLELPDTDGFEAMKTIRSFCPQAAVLIYTMHQEPWIMARLAQLDIQGVVSKAQPVATLAQAIKTISLGGRYFDREVLDAFAQVIEQGQDNLPLQPLSTREQQVLNYIVQGMTTPEIAAALFISENTVGTHRRHLMAKFCAHNVAQLVTKARTYIENNNN